MSSSSDASSAAVEGLRRLSPLPPIPRSQPEEEEKEASGQRRKRLLNHRRSRHQRDELHKIMVSSAMDTYRARHDRSVVPKTPEPQFPSTMYSEDRKRRMNYMFLKQCVESRPIAPIPQRWLDNVLTRVPPQLREGPGGQRLLQELCGEVSHDFLSQMVQHTVNTVLQKPDIKGAVLEKEKDVTPRVLDFSRPWHDSFIRSRKQIKDNLHVLHPVMRAVLDLGYVTFSPVLLADLSGCRPSGPVDCESLKNKTAVECRRVEERLMNSWFPRIIHLLTSKDMMRGVRAEKLEAFYGCVTTLISNQAHTLATQDGSLCTEQDFSSQRFSCMSMPDTQDQHMSPLSPASDCSSKIDAIHSKMENLVHEINESRTSELKMMDSFKDMIVVKVTDMCQERTERMYAVYEVNSHDMAVKLQELSEVLESCSKLNEELQEACQALACLRKGP